MTAYHSSAMSKTSEQGFNSELMLFQPPVVNTGVDYIQWVECRPLNQLTDDGSLDLQVKVEQICQYARFIILKLLKYKII